ncbi:MAG: hypothetical protein LIO63_07105 [Akkermansia sp.]|nr:hypothetical protein [Akkermansia sp.]
MKRLLAIVLPLLMSLAVLQAGRVSSYPDALRRAGDHGAVLFCYGVGWDQLGDRAYNDFVKSRKIDRIAKGAPVVVIPLYDSPAPDEKKNFDRIMGGRGLPGGIHSTPCLAIVDSDGNVRDVVQGADEMGDVEKALELLEQKLETVYKQNKLLASSLRAHGGRRLRLLSDAFDLGPKIPGKFLKDLPDDPAYDKDGYAAKLKFDPIALVGALQNKGLDEAEAKVRGMLELKSFSKEQRQLMYAALTGHLRRNGADAVRLRKLYEEMAAIDPDSMYGAYAKEAINFWCGGGVPSSEGRNAIEPGSGVSEDDD